MINFKKAIIFGLFGWLTLAIFSISHYSKILTNSCYFGSGWLYCTADVSTGLKVLLVVLIFLIVSCLIISGFFIWKSFKSKEDIPQKSIAAAIITFILLALLVVPFGSGDMTFYFSSGKAVTSGLNVFTQDWSRENIFVSPITKNYNERFSYGPVMAHVFTFFYKISQDNMVLFVVIWKLMSVIFFITCGLLTFKLIKIYGKEVSQKYLYLLWFLQPIILFEWIVNGHFDSLWLIFLLLAMICAVKKKWWLVMPLLVFGMWIKFIPAFFIPWFILKWWQDIGKDNWKAQLGQQIVAATLSTVITVAVWAKFWQGLAVFDTIKLLSKLAVGSTFSVIYYTLEPVFKNFIGSNFHPPLTLTAHIIVVAVIIYFMYPIFKKIYLVIVKKYKLSENEFVVTLFLSLLIFMMFWQKASWPWYMIWLLPLGIIAFVNINNEYLNKMLIWLSLSSLFSYVVWLLNWVINRTDTANQFWFFYYMVFSIYAFPFYYLLKWRKLNYQLEIENGKQIPSQNQ